MHNTEPESLSPVFSPKPHSLVLPEQQQHKQQTTSFHLYNSIEILTLKQKRWTIPIRKRDKRQRREEANKFTIKNRFG